MNLDRVLGHLNFSIMFTNDRQINEQVVVVVKKAHKFLSYQQIEGNSSPLIFITFLPSIFTFVGNSALATSLGRHLKGKALTDFQVSLLGGELMVMRSDFPLVVFVFLPLLAWVFSIVPNVSQIQFVFDQFGLPPFSIT